MISNFFVRLDFSLSRDGSIRDKERSHALLEVLQRSRLSSQNALKVIYTVQDVVRQLTMQSCLKAA